MRNRIRVQAQEWIGESTYWFARHAPRLRVISLGLLVGLAAGVLLLPGGGFDWYCCYSKYAVDPFISPRPPWLSLILQPFVLLPHSLVWYTLFNAVLIGIAILLAELPHPLLVLSLPVFWVLFYGQVDGLMALGGVLAWRSVQRKQPVWLGLAVLLLTVKPHIGLPLSLYLLWQGRNWKILVIPAAFLFISLPIFGFWPVKLFESYMSMSWDSFTTQTVNISLWPWALAALPLLAWRWRRMDRFARAAAVLAATCLLIPYSPVYSLIVLLFLTSRWPLLALLLLPAWGGRAAAQLSGMAFALGVLAWALWSGRTGEPQPHGASLTKRTKEPQRPRDTEM